MGGWSTPPQVTDATGAGRAAGDLSPALPWHEWLVGLHRTVRSAVLASRRGDAGVTNPKGDDVKIFDLGANTAALEYLEALGVPLRVESEETAPQEMGAGTPALRLVLDPVDGSDNWARGLPLSAVCCAVLASDAPLHPDFVVSALVGPLEWETPLVAE